MKREDVLAILREFKRARAEVYGILEIGVFGSVAREEVGEDSDEDICIKTRTPNPFVLVHIREEIEKRVNRRVEIVRVREKMNAFLRERIERERISMKRLPLEYETLARLCRRYHIRRLSLFGSVLRGDDRPDSDVDLLVEFEPGKAPGRWVWPASRRNSPLCLTDAGWILELPGT